MDIQFPSPNCLAHQSKITPIPIKGITMPQNNKICAISATSFRRIVNNANNRYGKVEQFALSLYEINTVLAKEDDKKPDIRTIVPPEYHDYLKIFEKANADKLPQHCASDHTIPLTDGLNPPFRRLYSLSRAELEELKCWLDENLSKDLFAPRHPPLPLQFYLLKKEMVRYH
jgi:hypothetical protein